jgi:TonB family protein
MKCHRLLPRFIPWLLIFESGIYLFAADGGSPRANAKPDIVFLANEQGVDLPVVLQKPEPAYTEEARASSVEGNVLIQATVMKDGTVRHFKVLECLGYGLDESAMHSIATQWRFSPGTRDGVRVDVPVNIGISFRIDSLTDIEREKRKEYPLRAFIFEATWTRKALRYPSGSGFINILEGDSLRGFEYTSTWTSLSKPFKGDISVFAKWIEPGARLEFLMPIIGNPTKLKACELIVVASKVVYMPNSGGGLTSLAIEQWKDLRDSARALERALHPFDTDPEHYPLKIELTGMNWSPYETYGRPPSGFSGSGQGNIHVGDQIFAFDFKAVCPSPIRSNTAGTFYSSRWKFKGSQLLVLSPRMGESQNMQACELATSLRPQ